ncbi:hypothetical protein DEI98_04170 [Curtobacterium sp. MCLR17_034]|nr:hypothetical protein DEI98_04170 [Curtobacterium sp. MCLR17_034]
MSASGSRSTRPCCTPRTSRPTRASRTTSPAGTTSSRRRRSDTRPGDRADRHGPQRLGACAEPSPPRPPRLNLVDSDVPLRWPCGRLRTAASGPSKRRPPMVGGASSHRRRVTGTGGPGRLGLPQLRRQDERS